MDMMIECDGAEITGTAPNRRKLRMLAVEVEYGALKARRAGRSCQIAVAAHAVAVSSMRQLHNPAMLHMAGCASRRKNLVLLVGRRLVTVEAGFIGRIVLEADHLYAVHHVAVA